jgi:transcriptional regulator with XRE-family HTH domain
METNKVCRTYRAKTGLSLRRFADAINEKLVNTDVSFGTVNRWEAEERPYEPDMRLLFECLSTYTDWRAKWAADCLRAMWPDLTSSKIVVIDLPKAE